MRRVSLILARNKHVHNPTRKIQGSLVGRRRRRIPWDPNAIHPSSALSDCLSSICSRRWMSSSSSSSKVIPGPAIQFGTGRLAQQTLASVVGHGGSTVVLTTVAAEYNDIHSNTTTNTNSVIPALTVEFRQRFHAVGKIPTNRLRKDHALLSVPEVLSSRAIDRALRPLIIQRTNDNDDEIGRAHV